MARKFHRHKLLLDEGFPIRSYFPFLNSRFDIKHITRDFKKVGLSDSQVRLFAAEHDRIVVTLNIKDFKSLVPINKTTGVIGVSANLPFILTSSWQYLTFIKRFIWGDWQRF